MKRTVAFVGLVALSCSGLAVAQETTGDIIGTLTSQDGLPLPGVTVTVENTERGFARSAISAADGRYKLVALPPAQYDLTAGLDGFKTVKRPIRVELGATVTGDVEMQVGEFTDTIEVTGAAPIIDVKSTVSGFSGNADELSAQLPISRDVTRVALLAPGTIDADPRFSSSGRQVFTPGQSVPVIAGASAAENAYIVNGLNITSFSGMIGSSFVPMEFVDEVQVKTGGYQAEYGRSTGGVVNLVTKSGTNTLRGGASVYSNPEGLQETEPDTYRRNNDGDVGVFHANSSDRYRSVEGNASLGGAILRDRLFLFGFVRYSDWQAFETRSFYAVDSDSSEPYWGGKLDWNISSSHRLEGTFLSDVSRVDQVVSYFDPDTGTLLGKIADNYQTRGGENWAVKYTGILGTTVALSAQAGVNPFDRTSRSPADDVCPSAYDVRDGSPTHVGCWANLIVGSESDERVAYRGDVDWFVGNHGLRAGIDAETNTTTSDETYSADVYYRYFVNGTEGEPPETYLFDHLPWDQELVRVRHASDGGSYDILSNAAYVQDSWAITPNLTLDLGVRWERFESKNAVGDTLMEINDQVAPRLGVIWDLAGDGRSKLYGSFGVYHLPMSSSIAVNFAGALYFDQAWYLLVGGIDPDGSPEGLGDELEYNVWADGEIPDTREVLDDDFEPMSQSEFILGYERLVGDAWSVGVRGVARRFNEIIEDLSIDKALWEVYGVECTGPDAIETREDCLFSFRVTNPGSDFSGWHDLDGDGELDPIAFTAEELGYPDAERTYLAVELSARRRFADRWMLQASYTWSHLYGNYDGLANSDVGQYDPYLTQTFDVAALLEHAKGDLPNDRRHNFKLFGMYAFDFGLQLSGNAWFRSERPVNGFGMHPTDPWAAAYTNYAFYNGGEPCPRGCGGQTDSAWALDLGVRYDWQWLGATWYARVDAMNVTDNGSAEVVDEQAELGNRQPNPSYLLPRYHQAPRSVRLGFGVNF